MSDQNLEIESLSDDDLNSASGGKFLADTASGGTCNTGVGGCTTHVGGTCNTSSGATCDNVK